MVDWFNLNTKDDVEKNTRQNLQHRVIERLVYAISQHPHNFTIQHKSIDLLGSLAFESKENRNKILQTDGIIEMILTAYYSNTLNRNQEFDQLQLNSGFLLSYFFEYNKEIILEIYNHINELKKTNSLIVEEKNLFISILRILKEIKKRKNQRNDKLPIDFKT
eukprot:Anaeramoba_ignava/c21496_g2_i1.p2 GENE.c21496_g2_i1~~c21496_g2_i1.p2  ORF type:complete len:163 (+),score=39.90 c21496_g2_i1:755-1243(+)